MTLRTILATRTLGFIVEWLIIGFFQLIVYAFAYYFGLLHDLLDVKNPVTLSIAIASLFYCLMIYIALYVEYTMHNFIGVFREKVLQYNVFASFIFLACLSLNARQLSYLAYPVPILVVLFLKVFYNCCHRSVAVIKSDYAMSKDLELKGTKHQLVKKKEDSFDTDSSSSSTTG